MTRAQAIKMAKPRVIAEAKKLWQKRCAEYMKAHGDGGTCVLGAGITPANLPDSEWNRGWVEPESMLLTQNDATNAQGSIVWEASVKEVIAFLAEHGIEATYHAGRMD